MSTTYGPGPAGANTVLNVTATTVLIAAPGMLNAVSVTSAGTAAGAVYDASTTGGDTAANLIGALPTSTTAAPLVFAWRCFTGILIVPPTGGAVSVSFA